MKNFFLIFLFLISQAAVTGQTSEATAEAVSAVEPGNGQHTLYLDNDWDGYGSGVPIQSDVLLIGYSSVSGDCDDGRDTVYPGAPELADGRDNDCDGLTDEGIAPEEPEATLPVNESFESGLGLWQQAGTDSMNWTRISGSTSSSGTGPSSATAGNYYLYTEASGYLNATAVLTSPPFIFDSGYSFSFSYHMYGSGMGSLELWVRPEDESSWLQVWSDTGNQGDQWLIATVDLSLLAGKNVLMKFVGNTGSAYTSDMAIDNLKFTRLTSPGTDLDLSDENYVFTRVYKEKAQEPFANPTVEKVIEEVTYFDGLGRPKQHIGIRQGAILKKDIVTHIGYNNFGIEDKSYLPYPETDAAVGALRTGTVLKTQSHYKAAYTADFPNVIAENTNPYSETRFEASPLNRPLEQGAPGTAWKVDQSDDADHTIKFNYGTNSANEVRLYSVSLFSTYEPNLIQSTTSFYPVGTLFKNITKDENWVSGLNNTTEEFKDKQGRVVLKRTYNAGVPHDTYYVYDDFGNLTYVIPPKVVTSDGISLAEKNELCYQYHYDKKNRLIRKKIPGKGTDTNWESIVYNKLDQPILTQDPNLKVAGKWLYTKYDAFGRVIATGLHINGSTTQAIMQGVVDNYYNNNPTAKVWEDKTSTSANDYYTNQSYPATGNEVLTLNYYDNYTFDHEDLILSDGAVIFEDQIEYTTKGLPTGSKVKVLDQEKWITTINHYNKEGRVIYTATYNDFLETTDKVKNKLNFTGTVLKTETFHKKGTAPAIVIIDNFTYDHVNRLKSHTQSINGSSPEMIADNSYDELGQLTGKGVGNIASSTTRLQDISYSYNVRGWLKTINDINSNNKLFNFKLSYDQPTTGTPLYNGNIRRADWRTANTDSGLKYYKYYYDDLNRLTKATGQLSVYNEFADYDKNGNIISLRRGESTGYMDHLTYYYHNSGVSNQLRKVTDSGTPEGFEDGTNTTDDYAYDANGNLTSDANKGITAITYNHLNLPELVTIGGQIIDYTYDATGVKLKKEIPGKVTEYAGNFVYEKIGTGSNVLQFFSHPEGYVSYDGGQFNYVYNYKDHLGNLRLSYTDANQNNTNPVSLQIIQEKNYYPFGLTHKGYNTGGSPLGNAAAKRYGFGGKELQDENISGSILDWYDVSARNYDPALGRWMNIDPLAEQMKRYSPYNYAFDNPLRFTDPDGMAPEDILIWYKENGKSKSFRISSENVDQIGEIAKKTDSEFLKQTLTAISSNLEDCGGLATENAINDDKETYEIQENYEGEGSRSYRDNQGTRNMIAWDDNYGVKTKNGDVLSPATVLEHELDHAYHSQNSPKEHKALKNTPDKDYTNLEEKRVITGNETYTARKKGEISPTKSQSRYSHGGNTWVKVKISTSTVPIKEN